MIFDALDKKTELFLVVGIVIAVVGWIAVFGTSPYSGNVSSVGLLYAFFVLLGLSYFWFAKDINEGSSLLWVLGLVFGAWFVVNTNNIWLYWVLFGGLIGLAVWGRKL